MSPEISVSRSELRAAIEKMEARTGHSVNGPLAVNLACKVQEFMRGNETRPPYPFAEALRYAMNELFIPFPRRKSYRAVMGSYFGTHGAHVAVKNKKSGKRAKAKKCAPARPEVLVEPDGQMAFRM